MNATVAVQLFTVYYFCPTAFPGPDLAGLNAVIYSSYRCAFPRPGCRAGCEL